MFLFQLPGMLQGWMSYHCYICIETKSVLILKTIVAVQIGEEMLHFSFWTVESVCFSVFYEN